MNGQIRLERIGNSALKPYVRPGPLIDDLLLSAGGSLEDYLRMGGYEVARRIAQSKNRDEALQS